MLSAVELHSGGGSGFYSHHHPTFGRPLAPTGSSDVQYSTTPQMQSEFARPKPKSIGSCNASLNGLSPSAISPPTHKYSHHLHPQQQQHHEQNGPVNLAVNHHHQQSTRQQQHSTSDKEHSEKDIIDVVGLGNGNSGNPISFSNNSSSRIPSFPAGLGSNAYQALNYNFYGNRYK